MNITTISLCFSEEREGRRDNGRQKEQDERKGERGMEREIKRVRDTEGEIGRE